MASPVSLGTLPPEIILTILRNIPHDSLLIIAHVSRSFHQQASVLLYRHVHFNELYRVTKKSTLEERQILRYSKTPMPFPDWSRNVCYPIGAWSSHVPGRRDSKIYKFDLFLRTISKSPHLRSLVSACSFRWVSFRMEKLVFEAVARLGTSLNNLHLRATYRLEEFKSLTALTSLEIHASLLSLKDPVYPFDKHQTSSDMLYSLFCLPTLKSLAIMGLVSWDIFRHRQASAGSRAKTSNIVHLLLPATVVKGPDLAEVLTWPKALQSLRIEDFNCEIFALLEQLAGDFFTMTTLSGAEIAESLQSQRETLEELSLSCRQRFVYDKHESPGVDLTSFPKLRHLRIPREFVLLRAQDARVMNPRPMRSCLLDSDSDDEWIAIMESITPVSAILPPSLEELHLKISPTPTDSETPDEGHGYYLTDFDDEEASGWLCDLAQNKDRYPALKTVIAWQFDYKSLSPSVKEIEELEDPDGTFEVETAFEEAGIDIYWVTSAEPPMFRG